MSRLSITPLGTNGFIPTHGRQTQCYLVRRDASAFVLDAGTGLGRLLEAPLADALRGLERLEIVLTHYHLDHTVGLSYLTAVAGLLPVRIHAPAPPLVDGTPEALSRLIAPPLFPLRFVEFPIAVEVVPYHGNELEVGGARLRLRRQEHAGRFGGRGDRRPPRLPHRLRGGGGVGRVRAAASSCCCTRCG
jgi:glyoxylase-like metal-dependent hydrolase (beta-lactamase superfamily II)